MIELAFTIRGVQAKDHAGRRCGARFWCFIPQVPEFNLTEHFGMGGTGEVALWLAVRSFARELEEGNHATGG